MSSVPEPVEKGAPIWRQWWETLQRDRAGRAELRRCSSISEAAFCAPYHLLRRMKGNPEGEFDLKRLGLIAAVLAHVTEDLSEKVSLGGLMATPQGEKPVVSDQRFRRLLRADAAEFDERLRDLFRVLHQLGGRAPIDRLANDLWWWNDRTRRQWALDYYELASPKT